MAVKLSEHWGKVLRVLASIFLLWLLFSRFDWLQMLPLLGQANWWWILLATGLFFGRLSITGWRWAIILGNFNIDEPWWRLTWINVVGLFWSNFLPSTVGGDGYRFLALQSKWEKYRVEIGSSILSDRVSGMLGLLFLHVVVAAFVFADWAQKPYLVAGEIVISLGTAMVVLAWLFRQQLYSFYFRIQDDIAPFFRKFLDVILRVLLLLEKQKKTSFLKATALSVVFAALLGSGIWCFFASLGIYPDFPQVLYAATLANIIGMLPISLNGLGSMEAVYVLALQAGISGNIVLLVALLARSLKLAVSLLSGGGYALKDVFAKKMDNGT